MKIFETERLIIRRLESIDTKYFVELFTDSKIFPLSLRTSVFIM